MYQISTRKTSCLATGERKSEKSESSAGIEPKAKVMRSTKTANLSCNIAAKLFEKRPCAFYSPRTICLATKTKNVASCCSVVQTESRFVLLLLQNQYIFFVARQVTFCVRCKTRNIAFRLVLQGSNVARQVGRFCCSYCRSLRPP